MRDGMSSQASLAMSKAAWVARSNVMALSIYVPLYLGVEGYLFFFYFDYFVPKW
jgi:hypothetical protein